MQLYRKNILIRLLLFVTAFQVLNVSIDAPGAQMSNYTGSNDRFNYIDSYIEFVAEIILKYENAIPETHNRQQKELQQHKLFQVICQTIEPIDIESVYRPSLNNYIAYSDQYIYQYFKEIKPPPEFS